MKQRTGLGVTAGTIRGRTQSWRQRLLVAAAALLGLLGTAQAQDNSTFTSQSVPTTLYAGQTFGVVQWYTNSGTTTWTGNGSSGYGVASENPHWNTTWGAATFQYLAGPVAPGAQQVFTFNVTAPAAVGSYTFQTRMIGSGGPSFGAFSTPATITVTPALIATVTASKGSGSTVAVSWTASATSGVLYDLRRCATANDSVCAGGWTTLVTGQAGTSYTDTPPIAGAHYLYQPIPTKAGYSTAATFDAGWSQATYNSAFVSQTVPTTMQAGQQYTVTQTWQNTGGLNWVGDAVATACSTNAVAVGAATPADNTTWGISALQPVATTRDRVYLATGNTILPGSNRSFTYDLTAPTTPGTYTFQRQLVSECVGFFGALSTAVTVTVVGTPTAITDLVVTQGTVTDRVNVSWGAKVGAVDYQPMIYSNGSWANLPLTGGATTYSFDIVSYAGVKSAGDYGSYPFAVLAKNAAGTLGPLPGSPPNGWANGAPTAATLDINADAKTAGSATPVVTDPNTAQGEAFTYTLLTTLAANEGTLSVVGPNITWTPAAAHSFSGTKNFSYRITDKGGATFDATGTLHIADTDDAIFVSQTVPATVFAGTSVPIVVTFQNSGTNTWQNATGYALASQNPANNTTWGAATLANVASSVTNGANYTYTFNVTAPSTPGTYNFQTQNAHSGVFFGATSPNTSITVVGPQTVHATNVAASDGTLTGKVHLTWTDAAGATTYAIWRKSPATAYVTLGNVNAGVQAYDDTIGLPAESGDYTYGVQACNGAGCANVNTMPSDTGYPNIAPTSASAALTATPIAPSAPVTPTVVDPNTANGDTEVFTFSNVTEAGGEGTVAVVAGKLVYTPPVSPLFVGVHAFNFTATDKGGASVTGTGSVTVAGIDGITYVSVAAPAKMFINQSGTATVTVTNSGSTTWTGPAYGIGSDWPSTSSNFTASRAMLANGATVAMGTSNVYTVNLTAPATPGTYYLNFKALSGPGAWFGSPSSDATIVVVGPPPPPPNVAATSGTQTGQVTVSWNGNPSDGNTASYTVYRTLNSTYALGNPTWTAISGALPFGTNSFVDSAATDPTIYVYAVTATNAAGESVKSAVVTGYANVAPTLATATLTATSATASPPVTPTVVDPNEAASEIEAYTVTIASQPAAGQGTASVTAGKLLWTPPADGSYAGNTSFTFTVVDRGNAAVVGTATVSVSAFVPAAPTGVTATQGTLTGLVRVTWNAVSGATSYRVFRGGTQVSVDPLAVTSFDYTAADATSANFTVRAVGAAGSESSDSSNATGWGNVAPVSTTAALTATALSASAGVTPTVVDPNVTAGEPESFTFTVTGQPTTGQGTASVVSNKLVWAPPADGSFAGSTSFPFVAVDKGGASVAGTATVTVAPFVPTAPSSVAATQGTLTGVVRVSWYAVSNVVAYDVYQAGVKVNAAPITGLSYDVPNSNAPVVAYTVRSLAAAGGQSPDSVPANGYPNVAPTATSATLNATAMTASALTLPTVLDPNATAGEVESYTFAIVSQPAAGEGSAAVSSNRLQWTPPAGNAFSGSTQFDFSATDKGGATVTGTATVTVAQFVPGAPSGVTATQGTLTGLVRVTWNAVANATSYEVFRAGVQVASGLPGAPYDFTTTDPAKAAYTVRAVAASGGESASSLGVQGWPNVAPLGATVTGTAPANAAGAQFSIVVDDPNAAAAEPESFTYTPSSGPTTMGGSFAFSGGKLLYSAPPGVTSAATDSFTFTVADHLGQTGAGVGSIDLCPAPQVGSGTGTLTSVNASVTVLACNGAVSAIGKVMYVPLAGGPTQVASFTQANATAGVGASYTVTRPANARAGDYAVQITLTDAAGQSSQGSVPFTVACPAPASALSSVLASVDMAQFQATGNFTSSDVCAGAMTATLQAFASSDVSGTNVLASGSLVSGTLAAGGGSAPLGWQFAPLPPGTYRAVQTVSNADGQNAVASSNFTVNCNAPTLYGVGLSQESGLVAASGLVLISACNDPANSKVTVTPVSGLLPTLVLPLTLHQTNGPFSYYRFDYPVAGVANGTYALNLSVTDGQGTTTAGSAQLTVDRGTASAQLTVNGMPATGSSGGAESLGRFGFKPGSGGLPSAVKQ